MMASKANCVGPAMDDECFELQAVNHHVNHNPSHNKSTAVAAARQRTFSINEIIDVGHNQLLPFDRFSQWIYCVVVVTFDIEIGQTIEVSLEIRSLRLILHSISLFAENLPFKC